MIEEERPTVPIWFWVISVIALLWNLVGLLAFAGQMMMTEETLATLPEEQQALYQNIPVWVIVCFAIAVLAGVLGSLLLLFRSRLAVACLFLSLLGVIGQYGHMFFMTKTMEVVGIGAMVLPVLVVIISIALVPFSKLCQRKGILN